MERVRFFFDFLSPYTYLASTQVPALAARSGAEIDWVPALLGGIMKATGNVPPATLPARGAYMAQDVPRWAEIYGVPFVWSPFFAWSSPPALRATLAVKAVAPAKYDAWVKACFHAAWGQPRDLSKPETLAAIAGEVGVDAALVTSANDDQARKDELKKNTEAAVAGGAFGLPAFVIGDGPDAELFFGNDRLELLEKRLKRGKPYPRMATIKMGA